MRSKIEAARKAAQYGIPTRVVRGDAKDIVLRVLRGEELGTLFLARKRLPRKKCWIAFAFRPKGKLWVDNGAERAIVSKGKASCHPASSRSKATLPGANAWR